jgi:hypothetical protein
MVSIAENRDTKTKFLEDLNEKRLINFIESLAIIATNLKEMYRMITLGGDAKLELVSVKNNKRSDSKFHLISSLFQNLTQYPYLSHEKQIMIKLIVTF